MGDKNASTSATKSNDVNPTDVKIVEYTRLGSSPSFVL